ncbi:hypothetical protein TNCV_295591 [Trichonephila clavipes]|nr:hypothetical protein TNCV_295591 [Trichonephila clavipes]
MPSEQRGMFPNKGNDLRRPLEHLEEPTLKLSLPPTLQKRDLDIVGLQQDGSTAHTFRISVGILRAAFPECLILLRGYVYYLT